MGFPGVTRVYSPPCPGDTHYQFSIKTLLSNCTSLNSRGSVHSSGTSPSLQQAVTWSLTSPFYNDTIHLTGVYVFPNEGNLEEFFDTLTVHSNRPCHEPHIYAGDFNAWTAEEIEGHITPLDSHALIRGQCLVATMQDIAV